LLPWNWQRRKKINGDDSDYESEDDDGSDDDGDMKPAATKKSSSAKKAQPKKRKKSARQLAVAEKRKWRPPRNPPHPCDPLSDDEEESDAVPPVTGTVTVDDDGADKTLDNLETLAAEDDGAEAEKTSNNLDMLAAEAEQAVPILEKPKTNEVLPTHAESNNEQMELKDCGKAFHKNIFKDMNAVEFIAYFKDGGKFFGRSCSKCDIGLLAYMSKRARGFSGKKVFICSNHKRCPYMMCAPCHGRVLPFESGEDEKCYTTVP